MKSYFYSKFEKSKKKKVKSKEKIDTSNICVIHFKMESEEKKNELGT